MSLDVQDGSGVQFTSLACTNRLERAGIAISMDGRGRALDNILVERLWRTVKYEDITSKTMRASRRLKRASNATSRSTTMSGFIKAWLTGRQQRSIGSTNVVMPASHLIFAISWS